MAGRLFATNPKNRDDELYNKSYSDRFDESDSLEVGKEELAEPLGNARQEEEQKGKAIKMKAMRRPAKYNGPLFRPLFRPLFGGFDDDLFPSYPFGMFRRDPFIDHVMPVLRRFLSDPRMNLLRSSPGYEIKESGRTYQIAVDVPDGVNVANMTVDLEDEGRILHVTGESKKEEDGMVSETRFDQQIRIGANVDTDKITANLADGVLFL